MLFIFRNRSQKTVTASGSYSVAFTFFAASCLLPAGPYSMLYALCQFTDTVRELLVRFRHNLLELILAKYGKGRFIFQVFPRLIIKGLLSVAGHSPENFHHRYVVRTGIGTLAAANTCRAHMGYTSNMEKDRVSRHFEDTFAFRPA